MRLSMLACAVSLALSGAASALELGHSRVVSAPGQPLIVQVPLIDLPEAQAQTLSVTVAKPSDWQAAGLKPPVELNSLSLTIQPGRTADSRLIEIRSNQAAQVSVVDMLLAVRTETADRTLQTSIIVPPPPQVRLAGQQITVQRGDTLAGIASQFPVQGANLHQQLWALYTENPRAFINENMNLVRAGASLSIPSDDKVRAVDPAFARAQYLEHVRAFRQMRGGAQSGNQGVAAQGTSQASPTAPETQSGTVEQPSDQQAAPLTDQVRLTAAEQDQATAQAKARQEELGRTQTLESNIEALKEALAQAQSAAQGEGDEAVQQAQQALDAAIQSTESAAQSLENVVQSTESAMQTDVQSAGEQLGQATDSVVSSARESVDQVQDATQSAAEQVQDATQSAAEQVQDATQSAAEQVEQASDAVATSAQNVIDQAQESAEKLDSQAASIIEQDGLSGTTNESPNAFSRLGQWVTDNLTAAILSLLGLLALIIAWVLRKSRAKASEGQQAAGSATVAAENFKEQLKDIDLSLDQKSDPKG